MATGTSSSTFWSAPATDNAILEAMRNDLLYEVGGAGAGHLSNCRQTL
jgi:hypothetical protein